MLDSSLIRKLVNIGRVVLLNVRFLFSTVRKVSCYMTNFNQLLLKREFEIDSEEHWCSKNVNLTVTPGQECDVLKVPRGGGI